jgi:hypothetical protein
MLWGPRLQSRVDFFERIEADQKRSSREETAIETEVWARKYAPVGFKAELESDGTRPVFDFDTFQLHAQAAHLAIAFEGEAQGLPVQRIVAAGAGEAAHLHAVDIDSRTTTSSTSSTAATLFTSIRPAWRSKIFSTSTSSIMSTDLPGRMRLEGYRK